MALILPNHALVLRAYASLANAAPSSTDLNIHLGYVKDFGVNGYVQALNGIFSEVSNTQLAQIFLKNTGLDTIDLEGDGNNDNLAIATLFLEANAANRVGAILDLVATLQKTDLAPAARFNANFDAAYAYATNPANVGNRPFDASLELTLTTGQDKLFGTALDDYFKAYIQGGANSFNSGDLLDGGAGNDTLYADINASQEGFAITGETKGIENVLFRVQNNQVDSGDNNIAGVGIIDAQRMKDVLNWENNNSRGDLIIEDIRINDNQITKDITITMRETDPGHVDYGVYFDQNSLRNSTENASQMNLRVLDTYSTAQGKENLLDSTYKTFTFYASINGAAAVKQTFTNDEMDAAKTLDDMVIAIQKAADAMYGAGAVSVTLGAEYSVKDSVTSNDVKGREIVVATKGTGNVVFNTDGAGSGWGQKGTTPAVSGQYASFSTGAVTTTDLVTSTVVLDYVGRGSNGGDLVIGGLSVGDTSTSKGVQRFEITVEDDSRLQTINSTNNTLREVTIKNGAQSRVNDAYSPVDKAGGLLKVGGAVAGGDVALPGTASQHNAFGFSDVKLIDGSAMTGKLEFTAEITQASVNKYLNLADSANNPAADNVAFVYSGGSNNDTMNVVIDGAVVGSTNTLTGREDFTFTANGGAGNDNITVRIDGNSAQWLADQRLVKNVTVNGGEGNDTIRTPGSGDFTINAGAGNDTVYTDNSASSATANATWVVNAANTDVNDLQGTALQTNFLYGGKLHVAISGPATGGGVTAANPADALSGTAAAPWSNGYEVIVDIPTGENYAVNQYHLNQAIKKAINEDAVLSKLLVAQDGPANTLIIRSLVDGQFANNDLSLTIVAPTVLAAGEQAAAEAALKKFYQDSSKTYAADFATDNDNNAAAAGSLNGLIGFSAAGLGAGSVLGTGVVAVGAVTEVATVTIGAAGLAAGENIVVNGLTINTAGGLTQAQVEYILENGLATGDAVLTGAYTAGWTVSAGAANTVVYTSTVAGTNVPDLAITDSTTPLITVATTQGAAATTSTVTLTGSASTADTINVIDMGAGASDVLVLSTSINGLETLKVTGYDLGKTTIVNFSDVAASQDTIDFTAYLVDKASTSGSVDSQQRIATSASSGTADTTVAANEVVVLTGAAFFDDSVSATTFAGLTAEKLLAAVNSTNTGTANYGTIGATTLDATNTYTASGPGTTLVGGVGHAVVMIENNQNLGEYKVFELTFNGTASNATQDFTAAKLIGTFDFGASLTITTADLV